MVKIFESFDSSFVKKLSKTLPKSPFLLSRFLNNIFSWVAAVAHLKFADKINEQPRDP
jgi:hypothetical protein